MEQSNGWAWTKQKDGLIRPSSEDVSWEEQAFAKDAAGPHGGCWPPRSYSCSFCRREFRSAQALGGHMNVHRRDRARLNQSHNNDLLVHDQNNHINEVYNPNPNLDFNTRVFVPPTKDEVIEDILVDQYPSSSMMMQKHHKMNSPFSYSRSWSTFVSRPYYRDSESRQEEDKEIIVGSGFRALEGCIEPDLSIRLNSSVCRKRAAEEEWESYSSKRRASPLAIFIKSTSQEVPGLGSSSSFEEIDLELRLGDRPKVK